jgi:spermidine synthase
MKPWELLDRARTPEGNELTLSCRDREYAIRVDGKDLMSSRLHGSEEALARLGCARAQALPAPWVLVGGLGMGFTLRAALDALPRSAVVVVAELLAAVVSWNRGVLGPLAGHPLADPRVRVRVGDVLDVLRDSPGCFDAVLLDVDNGPDPLVQRGNATLYEDAGLTTVRAALRSRGVLAVWSACDDRGFEGRLRRCGFAAGSEHVRARGRKGSRHTIFIGQR